MKNKIIIKQGGKRGRSKERSEMGPAAEEKWQGYGSVPSVCPPYSTEERPASVLYRIGMSEA